MGLLSRSHFAPGGLRFLGISALALKRVLCCYSSFYNPPSCVIGRSACTLLTNHVNPPFSNLYCDVTHPPQPLRGHTAGHAQLPCRHYANRSALKHLRLAHLHRNQLHGITGSVPPGLLQLPASWPPGICHQTTTTDPECRGAPDFQRSQIYTHHPAAH